MKRVTFITTLFFSVVMHSCSKKQTPLGIAREEKIVSQFTGLGAAIGLGQLERTRWNTESVEYNIHAHTAGLIFSGGEHKVNLNKQVVTYSSGKMIELKSQTGSISSLNLTQGTLTVNRKLIKLTKENLEQLNPSEHEALILLSALYAEIADTGNKQKEEHLSERLVEPLSHDTPAASPCSWTVINVGGTKGIAIDRTNREVKSFLSNHLDCRAVLSVSTGCFWDDFYCVATQEIQCMQYCIFV